MNKYPFVLITIIFFSILSCYELYQGYSNFRISMLNKARDIADVNRAFGDWGAKAGTIYAPSESISSFEAPSNVEKEITDNGTSLTRINPAYMMRMSANELNYSNGMELRLISMKPINKQNTPKGWESEGYDLINSGSKEYSKLRFNNFSDVSFLYMTPLRITKSCMRCHEYVKYKEGDLRGAISISFPVTSEHNINFKFTIMTIMAYMLAAALVIRLIILSRRELDKAWQEKLKNIADLESEIMRREMSEAALIHKTRSSSINEILRMVAHHWRQPLNNIGLLIQTIQVANTRQEEEEASVHAIKIVKEMSETIDLFTSAAKVENKVRMDVKSMTFDALKLLRPEFESVGIEVYVVCNMGGADEEIQMTEVDNLFHSCGRGRFTCEDLCGFSHVYLDGEESMFKQILLIILKNSYDSLVEKPAGEERLITVRFVRKGDYAQIEICDNGADIAEENKSRLFEPYFSTKGCGAGKGIGLFTAQNLASNFDGGDLFYEDTNGKCFIFRFKPCGHD
jgi:signal transduction histidine kinase